MILSQLKTWWPGERCRRCATCWGHGAAPDCGLAVSGAGYLHGRHRWAERMTRWSLRCEGGPAGTHSSFSRQKSGDCARRPTCADQAARALSAAIEDKRCQVYNGRDKQRSARTHSSQRTVHRQRLSATLRTEQKTTVSAAWESKGHFPCAATTVACTLEQMPRGCSLLSH